MFFHPTVAANVPIVVAETRARELEVSHGRYNVSSAKADDNSTMSSVENETAELIAEIENVLKEEQWILVNRRGGNGTLVKEHLAGPRGQSNVTRSPQLDKGAESQAEDTVEGSGEEEVEVESFDGSEESPSSSEEEESSGEDNASEKGHGESNDDNSEYSTVLAAGTTETTKKTTSRPTSTSVKTTPASDKRKDEISKKTTAATTHASSPPTSNSTKGLPEAEEEESGEEPHSS